MTETYTSEFDEFDSRKKFAEILIPLLTELDGIKIQVLTNKITPENASKVLMDLDMILNKFLGVINSLNLMVLNHQNSFTISNYKECGAVNATDKT